LVLKLIRARNFPASYGFAPLWKSNLLDCTPEKVIEKKTKKNLTNQDKYLKNSKNFQENVYLSEFFKLNKSLTFKFL